MAEQKPPTLMTEVRFLSPAPLLSDQHLRPAPNRPTTPLGHGAAPFNVLDRRIGLEI